MLLPGDPGRALALATELLDASRACSTTTAGCGATPAIAADGEPLTIQSTGMGGPSAAIVLEELIALGVTRAIRVGTAGALDPALRLGELLVASEAICADGTSRALGAGERAAADPALTAALAAAAPRAPRAGTIVTQRPLLRGRRAALRRAGARAGARAVEMEAAALFALGALRGVAVACALAITDVLGGGARADRRRRRCTTPGIAVGRLGAAALGARLSAAYWWRGAVVGAGRAGHDAAGAAADEDPVGAAVPDRAVPDHVEGAVGPDVAVAGEVAHVEPVAAGHPQRVGRVGVGDHGEKFAYSSQLLE